jgi:hypothetical protein
MFWNSSHCGMRDFNPSDRIPAHRRTAEVRGHWLFHRRAHGTMRRDERGSDSRHSPRRRSESERRGRTHLAR